MNRNLLAWLYQLLKMGTTPEQRAHASQAAKHFVETANPITFEGAPEHTPHYVPPAIQGGSRTFTEEGEPVVMYPEQPNEVSTPLERLRAMRLRLRTPQAYNPPQSYTIPRKGNDG